MTSEPGIQQSILNVGGSAYEPGKQPAADTLPHLITIDVLRGLASLLVCWYHIANRNLIDVGSILAASGAHGNVGVPIFFVISGFVIPYSLYRGGYRISNFLRFVTKRIV